MDLKQIIRSFPDWPKTGVVFRDITPILMKPEILTYVVNELKATWQDQAFNLVAGIEARGFIFSSLLAQSLKKGLLVVRKEGKLPGPTVKTSYNIEYGSAAIEIQSDAIERGRKC